MESQIHIKTKLYRVCEKDIEARIQTIEKNLKSIFESRDNETKSSVGDKYETGRAMLQIEEANNKTQLIEANRVKNELTRIDLKRSSIKAEIGSLVKTNRGYYYISIGLGKVTLEDTLYFCVSINSPIGTKLLSKTEGDAIEFNGKRIEIEEIW